MQRRTRANTRQQKDVLSPKKEEIVASSDSESEDENRFEFEGKVYKSYQEMVNAKRKRNEEYLKQSGLWNASAQLQQQQQKTKKETNGIKKRKVEKQILPRRQSSRLQGTPADGLYIEDEKGGTFTIKNSTDGSGTIANSSAVVTSNNYSKRRVNDGSPLSVEEAVNLCEPKWIQETSVQAAKQFVQDWKALPVETYTSKQPSMDDILSRIENLSIDDDNQVAKVTPDRIFSVATHPSTNQLIVGAGDKHGYVGLWNVDGKSEASNDGVHLFHPHTGSVNSLHWTSQGLLTSSYDGTVRYFDVAKECFEEVFAVDEDDDDSWYTQYLAMDSRANQNEQAFFLSTSIGTVFHVDRRVGGRSSHRGSITWSALLSEEGKKINSVSLHPDGYCLATSGLDRKVKFWDLRMFGSTSSKTDPKEPKGAFLGEHETKKSVNSAFFSPSGSYMVATTMSDTLKIYKDVHLQLKGQTKKGKKGVVVQPEHVIRHNNQTGRWLTTFMAEWHPSLDIFCVGSMQKPRALDIFDGVTGDRLRAVEGEALSAVASRCCFHPSTDKLILVGGNSSGRVTVIR